jgi:hypothetical protein
VQKLCFFAVFQARDEMMDFKNDARIAFADLAAYIQSYAGFFDAGRETDNLVGPRTG